MKNKHIEYKNIVDGADVAILCVHGIMGSPNHFRDLVPLIPKEYSIYNMVIYGHCSSVDDFAHASMEKWEKSVNDAIDELLATHKEVYVLAHSMGTLLTIERAMREPRISKLFCLSIPIKVGVKLRMLDTAMRIYFKRIRPKDKFALAGSECYGITDSKNIFKYLGWVPRFLELFKKIDYVRENLDKLETPCVAYQSQLDEMVSPKSIDILKKESKIEVKTLEKSTHFYYDPDETEYLKQEFMSFMFSK